MRRSCHVAISGPRGRVVWALGLWTIATLLGPSAPAGASDGIDEYDLLIRAYEVPKDSPTLMAPEIIVTLQDATVRLVDTATGFSETYEAGVGRLDGYGHSRTPTGRFTTGPDPRDPWWYMPRRITPTMYGGFPFLRFTAQKPDGGGPIFGFHGPVDGTFKGGYVSGGCVRMRPADLVRMFYAVTSHPRIPVTIQRARPILPGAVGSHGP